MEHFTLRTCDVARARPDRPSESRIREACKRGEFTEGVHFVRDRGGSALYSPACIAVPLPTRRRHAD
jgi:hypothetical protein